VESSGSTLEPMAGACAIAHPVLALRIAEPEPAIERLPASAAANRTAASEESRPPLAGLLPGAAAWPVESFLAASAAAVPVTFAAAVLCPRLELAAIAEEDATVPALEQELPAVVPAAGIQPIELRCRRSAASPSQALEWIYPAAAARIPPFAVRPVFERLQDPALAPPAQKKPPFAELFALTRAADPLKRRKALGNAAKAIAAGLFLCALLWFGRNTATIGRQMTAANQVTADADQGGTTQGAPDAAQAASAAPKPAPPRSRGAVAWLRAAIARRAATQLT
jgi:hypothetical protein